MIKRRFSAAALPCEIFVKIEAGMTPDPNGESGRHAPWGCQRS